MAIQQRQIDFLDEAVNPLAEAFRYTSRDLKLNRERRISGSQRRRLWLRFMGTAIGGLLLTLAPLLVTWGLLIWASGAGLSAALSDERALIGYMVGGILGGFYGLSNIKSLLLWADLLQSRVRIIKGPASVWGSYLQVGRYRFVIDERAAKLVQAGVSYRVYLLPASRTLLSIEFAD